MELSQDPISHASGSERDSLDGGSEYHGEPATSVTTTIKAKSRKRFETVGQAKFKMPEVMLESQSGRMPSCSDGFENEEGEPIGRLMPVKQLPRRKQSEFKMPTKFGKLKFVSEKPPEEPVEESRLRRKKLKKRSGRHRAQKDSNDVEPDNERMLLDVQEKNSEIDQMISNVQAEDPEQEQEVQCPMSFRNVHLEDEAQHPRTPAARTDLDNTSSIPASHTSLLTHMSQGPFFAADMMGSPLLKPKTLSRRPIVESLLEPRILIPSSPPSPPKGFEQEAQDDLIASQEISQVIMKRPSVVFAGHGSQGGERTAFAENTEEPGGEGSDRSRETYFVTALNEPEDDRMGASDESNTPSSSNILSQCNDQSPSTGTEYIDIEEDTVDVLGQDGNINISEDRSSCQPEESSASQLPAVRAMVEFTSKLMMELNEQMESVRAKKKKTQPLRKPQISRVTLALNQSSRSSQIGQSSFKTPTKLPNSPEQEQEPPSTDSSNSPWRPKVFDKRSVEAETRENIEEIPTPSPAREQNRRARRNSLRQRLISVRQPLRVTQDRPESPIHAQETISAITQDSQGSIELGNMQNFARKRFFPSEIPETQFEDPPEEQAEYTVLMPVNSYFTQASQDLTQSAQHTQVSRKLSMPAHVRFALQQKETYDNDMIMAGGMAYSAASQHTISSPTRAPKRSRLGLMNPSSSQASLKDLTRKLSIGMGTALSKKRRVVSVSLLSNFNKQ